MKTTREDRLIPFAPRRRRGGAFGALAASRGWPPLAAIGSLRLAASLQERLRRSLPPNLRPRLGKVAAKGDCSQRLQSAAKRPTRLGRAQPPSHALRVPRQRQRWHELRRVPFEAPTTKSIRSRVIRYGATTTAKSIRFVRHTTKSIRSRAIRCGVSRRRYGVQSIDGVVRCHLYCFGDGRDKINF